MDDIDGPPPQYPDHPIKIMAASGGFLGENNFITCGGLNSTTSINECFKLGSSGTFATMNAKRRWAASIILQKAEITEGEPTKHGQESHAKGGRTTSLISIGSLMLAITTSVGILMGIPMACGAQQPTQTLRTHISHF